MAASRRKHSNVESVIPVVGGLVTIARPKAKIFCRGSYSPQPSETTGRPGTDIFSDDTFETHIRIIIPGLVLLFVGLKEK